MFLGTASFSVKFKADRARNAKGLVSLFSGELFWIKEKFGELLSVTPHTKTDTEAKERFIYRETPVSKDRLILYWLIIVADRPTQWILLGDALDSEVINDMSDLLLILNINIHTHNTSECPHDHV